MSKWLGVAALLAGVAGACAHEPPPPAAPPAPIPPTCTEQRMSATLLRVHCNYHAPEHQGWVWNQSLRRAAVSALAAGFPLLQTLNVASEPLMATTSTPVECRVRRSVWRGSRAICTGGTSTVPIGMLMATDFEFLSNEQGVERNTPLIPQDRRPWSGAAFLSSHAGR
jgi:hypothetical protein